MVELCACHWGTGETWAALQWPRPALWTTFYCGSAPVLESLVPRDSPVSIRPEPFGHTPISVRISVGEPLSTRTGPGKTVMPAAEINLTFEDGHMLFPPDGGLLTEARARGRTLFTRGPYYSGEQLGFRQQTKSDRFYHFMISRH